MRKPAAEDILRLSGKIAATTSADTTPVASTLTLPTRPVTLPTTNSRKVALAERAFIDPASGFEGPVMTMLGKADLEVPLQFVNMK